MFVLIAGGDPSGAQLASLLVEQEHEVRLIEHRRDVLATIHHELPTEVWYKAYPGLSTVDLQRNALVRQGLEQPGMTAAEVSQWLSLF